jgi:hypothetical protein
MRVKRRLAVCFGLALLLLGERQSVLAQNEPGTYQMQLGSPPPSVNGAYAPAPNLNGPAGPPTSFNGSLATPEYSNYPSVIPPVPPPMPAGTYGSTINPYPAISPYDYSYQNDTNVGGIWEHTERTRDRKFYFDADFLWMQTRRPEGVFGNPNAQTYVRQVRDFIDGSSSSTGSSTSTSTSTSTSGDPNASSSLLQYQGYVTETPAYYASQANYYNPLDLDNEVNLPTDGARFTAGFWNPDNSGFAATFWFGGTASDNFNAADLVTQTPTDMKGLEQIIRFVNSGQMPPGVFALTDVGVFDTALNTKRLDAQQILEQNLLNLRGLPVADGTARGQTIPYDIYFDVKTTSQQIGTSLDYYFTPVFERKWITVSPSVGVTYLNIHESLSFLGIDSGLLYSPSTSGSGTTTGADRDFKAQSFPNGLDDDMDGIIDNAASPEPGPSSSTSSSTSGSTGSSTSAPFVQFGSPFALLPATINIDTMTNLVGPTGGLRYVIGGKSFHLIGETKFGVMANFEQISLSGNNIGSETRFNGDIVTYPAELTASTQTNPRPETSQDLIIATPQNPNPNAFSSSQVHAHVSPMFQQSVIAEAPVLQYIPVIKKIWPLNAAIFRVGYTFIWVGNVIDTNQSVNYQGDPMDGLFPTIEPSHSGWWTQNGSVGVSWEW